MLVNLLREAASPAPLAANSSKIRSWRFPAVYRRCSPQTGASRGPWNRHFGTSAQQKALFFALANEQGGRNSRFAGLLAGLFRSMSRFPCRKDLQTGRRHVAQTLIATPLRTRLQAGAAGTQRHTRRRGGRFSTCGSPPPRRFAEMQPLTAIRSPRPSHFSFRSGGIKVSGGPVSEPSS